MHSIRIRQAGEGKACRPERVHAESSGPALRSPVTRPADMNPFDLSGRTALVTGANTGLGQAIAVGLAQAGADIVAVGRSAPTETEAMVAGLGRAFKAISADLGSIAPIADVV